MDWHSISMCWGLNDAIWYLSWRSNSGLGKSCENLYGVYWNWINEKKQKKGVDIQYKPCGHFLPIVIGLDLFKEKFTKDHGKSFAFPV